MKKLKICVFIGLAAACLYGCSTDEPTPRHKNHQTKPKDDPKDEPKDDPVDEPDNSRVTADDSDGDGLSNDEEAELGTKPDVKDTDGDGASDLVEYLLETDPKKANDNPAAKGIVVFETPYKAKTSKPKTDAISFSPVIQKIDVYYALGYTESGYSIEEHSALFQKIINRSLCLPNKKTCASNADCKSLNTSKTKYICSESGKCITMSTEDTPCFEDIYTGYGWYGAENTFVNYQSLSDNMIATMDGISTRPNPSMNGANYTQPPMCVFGGKEFCTNDPQCYEGDDRVGCVGFRPDAVKMLVHIADYTQSSSKSWPVSKMPQVADYLRANHIRYAGVSQRYCGCNSGMKQLACYAGACDISGQCYDDCEHLSDCSNSNDRDDLEAMYFSPANGESIERFIRLMSANKQLLIEPKVVDVTPDASKLVAGMQVVTTGKSASGDACSAVGKPDNSEFQKLDEVPPATPICYSIVPVESQDVIPATDKPQLLEARVQVTAENSVLNSDHVYFVIPPAP